MIPYSWPNISWWVQALSLGTSIPLLSNQPFKKMTFRNRYEIGAANGKLLLSIPLEGGRNQRTPLDKVMISYQENWQKQHWKSIESAYRNSPFFEFYADAFVPYYQEKIPTLLQWNAGIIEVVNKLLKLPISFEVSNGTFNAENDESIDLGTWVSYHQPFEHKNGFIPNLSILDLLCCEGPQAAVYLSNLK